MDPIKRFELEYKQVCEFIRHYSATRSGLAAFLGTAALAAGSAAFSDDYQTYANFFVYVALVLDAAAILACFRFSYLTEHAESYQTELWRWSLAEPLPAYPKGLKSHRPALVEIWEKVVSDPMNLLLVLAIYVSTFAF